VEALPAKPRLRGVAHAYGAVAAVAAAVLLIAMAPSSTAAFAAGVYGVSLCGLLGTSALYHRIDWSTPLRRWMRRLDLSMIYLLIAGTYTPFALLVFSGPLRLIVLGLTWGGAVVGVVLTLLWTDAPRALTAVIYVALGWVAIFAFPQMIERAGLAAFVLVLAGGALYTAGALVYALRRPDPWPRVFGFHEFFHGLVVAAAASHYVAIVLYVLPRGGA
jgi:hemolysin III